MTVFLSLQTSIGTYLKVAGFRGTFSTDWLSQDGSRDLFLLEINPRFSSDLCLFDCRYDPEIVESVPMALMHLLATAECFASDLPYIDEKTPRSFEQMGGKTNRAYFPPRPAEVRAGV